MALEGDALSNDVAWSKNVLDDGGGKRGMACGAWTGGCSRGKHAVTARRRGRERQRGRREWTGEKHGTCRLGGGEGRRREARRRGEGRCDHGRIWELRGGRTEGTNDIEAFVEKSRGRLGFIMRIIGD